MINAKYFHGKMGQTKKVKAGRGIIPVEELGKLFESIEFDHTWIFCNGVLEEGEDEKTLVFYLKYQYRPNLKIPDYEQEMKEINNTDMLLCGIINKKFSFRSLKGRMD